MTKPSVVLRTLLAGVAILLLAACASTPTSRSTGEALDDVSISSRIKTALVASKDTDGLDIEVEVDRGRVQLNGFANSAEEKSRAEEIASGIRGVASVDNNLQVVAGDRSVGEYLDDKVIVARVSAALAKDSGVRASDVEVEVNRGTVQLGGYVDTAEERQAAGAAAGRVKGVSRVINDISVR